MGRLIKSTREWRCTNCTKSCSSWRGFCPSCKQEGTLQEILLNPTKVKPVATQDQRSLIRRSKNSERSIAKRMVAADGRDPAFDKIATSTGRIGHITNIRVDAISKNYVTENKNRKMPAWAIDAWLLINQKAIIFNKNALLHIDPPNMPKEFPVEGATRKLDTMAVITQTRHEELIKAERVLNELLKEIDERYPELVETCIKLLN